VRRVGAAVRTASRMVVGGALMLLLLLVCSAWMQLAAAQTSCSPGSGYSLITRTCEVCKPGTSSPGGLFKRCISCLPGFIAAQRGSRSCTKCASNRAPNAAKTACVAPPTCQPGYGASLGAAVCKPCVAGYYSAGGRNAQCKFCPAGKVATGRSSTSCKSCPAGQRANVQRSVCVPASPSGGGGGGGGAGSGGGTCAQCQVDFKACISDLGCSANSAMLCSGALSACRILNPCIKNCPA
jgi:hypothetical protein